MNSKEIIAEIVEGVVHGYFKDDEELSSWISRLVQVVREECAQELAYTGRIQKEG